MVPNFAPSAVMVGLSFSLAMSQLQWPGCEALKDGDFRQIPLRTAGTELMSFDIAKDGRIYYTQKTGILHSIHPVENTDVVMADLGVQSTGYIGLWGVALDPGFPVKPWIYLYYTPKWQTPPPGGADRLPEFRLSRFDVKAGQLDRSSEKVLLEVQNDDVFQNPDGSHTGGKLRFDPSGYLYLSTGDNRFWGEYPATNETDILHAPLATSSNTNDLRGKILRLLPKDDGTVSIPDGNLFPKNRKGARPEIFAMGLRNPIGLQIDPFRGWILVSEAGPDGNGAGGPLLQGGDEYHVFRHPANGGWPMFHGTDYAYPFKNYPSGTLGEKFNPQVPVNTSKWNTGLDTLPPIVPAVYLINKGQNTDAIGQNGGGMAAVAGPIYRYNPQLTSPVKFPPHFHGKWFVSNYFNPLMGLLTLNESGAVTSATQVFKNMTFRTALLEMGFGPDGALYVLSGAGIVKVEYAGSCRPTMPEPFRVSGCMDSAYTEFNPYADSQNPSACVTRKTPVGTAFRSGESIRGTSLESLLSEPGQHLIEIFNTNGFLVSRKSVRGGKAHGPTFSIPDGLHWVRVSTGNRRTLVKELFLQGRSK